VGLIFGQNDFSVCIFPPNVIEQFQGESCSRVSTPL
jgi:hypothetical protein